MRNTRYQGRIVVAGIDQSGLYVVQVHAVTVRNSKNRTQRLVLGGGGSVRNELIEPDPSIDVSLFEYTAMREGGDHYVVSNGRQTDSVFLAMQNCGRDAFADGLDGWLYEHDRHRTPRITSAWSRGGVVQLQFSILRKGRRSCEPSFWTYAPNTGFGFYLATYEAEGDPHPPFAGPPRMIPLVGSQEELADALWRVLDPERRVSLAVKFIEIANGRSSISLRNVHDVD
jgi:IMP cyclohydrolase